MYPVVQNAFYPEARNMLHAIRILYAAAASEYVFSVVMLSLLLPASSVLWVAMNTATIGRLIPKASIHPCNHAKVMKKIIDTIEANGGTPQVH